MVVDANYGVHHIKRFYKGGLYEGIYTELVRVLTRQEDLMRWMVRKVA